MNNSNWQEKSRNEKGVLYWRPAKTDAEATDFVEIPHEVINLLLEEERQGLVKEIENMLGNVRGQIIMTQDGMPYKLALQGHESALMDVLSLLTKEE